MVKSDLVLKLVEQGIQDWHKKSMNRSSDYVIVTDEIRRIKDLNDHREDITVVINELVNTNCEMWHEEDKVRSDDDATVLKAIRNINPLNQHRNDLIEEIDEIMLENIRGN